MKKILLVLATCAFIFLSPQNGHTAFYNPDTGHWYDLVDAYVGAWGNPYPPGNDNRFHFRSWTIAEDHAMASGGHLVTINDKAENKWLVDTFSALVNTSHTGVFIGLYQLPGSTEPGQGWVWISGTSSYVNWLNEEPNNAGGFENWGAMYLDCGWERNGYWLDISDPAGKFDFEEYRYGIAEYDMNPVPAPIPAAAWLLGSGLVGLVAIRRRRTR